MKKLKIFDQFVKEQKSYKANPEFDVKLKKLIDNDGNVLDKAGWAVEILGIVDINGNPRYMAGVGEFDDTFYVNISTEKNGIEGCQNNDGVFFPIQYGTKYNNEEKFNAQ